MKWSGRKIVSSKLPVATSKLSVAPVTGIHPCYFLLVLNLLIIGWWVIKLIIELVVLRNASLVLHNLHCTYVLIHSCWAMQILRYSRQSRKLKIFNFNKICTSQGFAKCCVVRTRAKPLLSYWEPASFGGVSRGHSRISGGLQDSGVTPVITLIQLLFGFGFLFVSWQDKSLPFKLWDLKADLSSLSLINQSEAASHMVVLTLG